jgi:hypothetical protein
MAADDVAKKKKRKRHHTPVFACPKINIPSNLSSVAIFRATSR